MIKKIILISLSFIAVEGSQDPSLLRVNKRTSLGRYVPQDLVFFDGHCPPGHCPTGVQVSKRIVKDLQDLLKAAKKDGLTLKVVSGYRSYNRQAQVFEGWVKKERFKNPSLSRQQAEKKVDTYSARPGHSEHQLGTTVDILSSENGYTFSADRKWKYVSWLEKNAEKFHFKISYPQGHPEYTYEPWHLRWYPITYQHKIL